MDGGVARKYFPGMALSEETSSTVYEKYEEGNGEEIDYFARFNLWRTSDANKYTKCRYGPDEDVDVGTCFHQTDEPKCRYGAFLEEPCLTKKEMRYECPFGSREAFGCPSCNKCIIHAFKTKHVILWDSSSGSGGALPIERRSAYMMTQKISPPEVVFSDELREALMETAEKRFGWTHAKSFGSYHHQKERKAWFRCVRNEFTVAAKDGSTGLEAFVTFGCCVCESISWLTSENWIRRR